jgi:hypothetical protein
MGVIVYRVSILEDDTFYAFCVVPVSHFIILQMIVKMNSWYIATVQHKLDQ